MTLSTTTSRVSTVGDGSTTEFSFPYLFYANDDLVVTLTTTATAVEVVQTITTHYTVVGAGVAAGGTVTMATAPASTETLLVSRVEQFTQGLDLVENDNMPSALVEQQFDILTMLAQQTNSQVDRSLRQPNGDTVDIAVIPAKITRASKVLAFNSAGNPETTIATSGLATLGTIPGDISTVAGISANVTTVAGIAANVTAVAGDATDIGAVAAKATEIGRLGTSDAVADMALLGTSAIVTDMDLLATSGNVTAMGLLGDAAVITDMGILGTADVVTDMNVLGTAAIVEDMDLLGTSGNVTAMGLLGVSAVITDMGILGTAAIVEDMDLLGTSGNVTAMGLLGVSGVITDMGLLGTAAVVEDMGILGTAAVVEDMALLGTTAVVADMALLGTTDAVADMNTLGTADVVSDLNTVAGIAGDVTAVAAQVVGYDFSTTTAMADPGSGNVRFNHATLASVSAIAIDDVDKNGVNQSAFIILWDDSTNTVKGTLVFRTAGGDVATFLITGLTDNSGWSQIAVTHVASSGTFANGEDTFIGFTRAGDKGADGEGAGDVVGPASATDNTVARYNSTTGKLIQGSGVTIDDSNNVGAASLTLTTDLAVTHGGTGASTAPAALSNLGGVGVGLTLALGG